MQLEREDLSDADLVQMAQEFRTQYLNERWDISDVAALEKARGSFRERRR